MSHRFGTPYASPMFLVGGFGIFFVIILLLWLAALASFALGVAALVSVSKLPAEAFGPWWDNTKQTWLVGIAVSFFIPFGHLITGIMWFTSGRDPLRTGGIAGRPFWAGVPRPQPPLPPPGWPTQPPPGWPTPPPGYGPPPPTPGSYSR
jgi:hypothetical protein